MTLYTAAVSWLVPGVGFHVGFALRVSVGNLVGPMALGRAVTLHPVVAIVAFLTGASLFGVLGVFVAVPVPAAAEIVLPAWYEDEEARLKAAGADAGRLRGESAIR